MMKMELTEGDVKDALTAYALKNGPSGYQSASVAVKVEQVRDARDQPTGGYDVTAVVTLKKIESKYIDQR